MVQLLWRTVLRFLKLKTELSNDLAVPLLGIYLRKPNKAKTWKLLMNLNVHQLMTG